ncbi:MAG: threonylcarbamoyl-AMP synthase [Gemmatimonadaceae bacterium]|nr:threonylcarbamoyl-AMP synthase [Gemmatimonadaceae bacterium]
MSVVAVDSQAPDPDVIAQAAHVLVHGGLVAFPTETVYGLGANALDAHAVQSIYAAKGRPAWNPVIAHVATIDDARTLASRWPATAEVLAQRFWPGPLTLVVPRASTVPDVATAGLDAVGVRMPDHPVALALIRAAGVPIAAPSANRFTHISPTTAAHVVRSLGERVPLVLDGGKCRVGIESTVVDCTGDDVVILRPGMLGREILQEAVASLGAVVRHAMPRAVAHNAAALASEATPRSPGMADRHYAPRADVWLFDPSQRSEIADALEVRAAEHVEPARSPRHRSPVVALLRTGAWNRPSPVPISQHLLPDAPGAYAAALYAALHDADATETALILIEAPPADDPSWDAVRDRLHRAAR